ncbi:hypothetical protein QTP88_002837 [Uroleucon formosanum]
MAEKRKRVVLRFNQKLEIIKRLKKDETATNIAQIYGVGRTTVNDIKRDAEKIEQHVSQMQSNDGDVRSRKTMKSAKYEQLDNNTTENVGNVSTEQFGETYVADLQSSPHKKKMVEAKNNTPIDVALHLDVCTEVPQSAEQWAQKKEKHTWLFCQNGLLGGKTCFEVSCLKTFKSRDFEISKEWSSCQISGGTMNKVTRLAILCNKIRKHSSSKAHKTAFSFITQKEENVLSKQLEKSAFIKNKSTTSVFRTAYYIAKCNRPFNDHFNLLKLQQLNGIKIGITLHSRFSCTNIIDHILLKMKQKIVSNIVETEAKLSVLINESTTISAVCGMVVYIKAYISYDDPVFIFLDLVELVSQTADNIVNQLVDCLKESGFNENYLIQNWILFVSDGASVLLGKKNGVAKCLKDRYPLIFSLHCMNHRLELAVSDAVKDVNATNHFKSFMDSLYVLYNASPKNQNELKNICNNLDTMFLKVGRVLDVRWVASSSRAVKVVWKMYEGLCNHFSNASSDSNRDSKTRAEYSGLRKRLASPEFLLDLGLMCDCLNELSVLSNLLQKRSLTLIQAYQHINRSIRVLTSFKDLKGEYLTKATNATNDMTFKNIRLEKNSKLININHNQFLTSPVDNLKARLLDNEQDISILQDMQIIDVSEWPKDINYNHIRYGKDEIKRLCKRLQVNKNDAINGFIQIDDQFYLKMLCLNFITWYKPFLVQQHSANGDSV